MARQRLLLILVVLSIAAALAWWTTRTQIFAPSLRLTPVAFADLPGWTQADPRSALAAFARSCGLLQRKNATTAMGGAGYAGTVGDWQQACHAVLNESESAMQARAFFERWAMPVEIGAGSDPKGTFTGYYEPEIRVSRRQHGIYQTPVYATPDNLFTVDLGQFRDDLAGVHITGCAEERKLVRCPTRAEIDARSLPMAKVLFYADDPITVFFLHIQGSGRARFDDGSFVRVAYDGQNGQPYTPIGRTLIADGSLPRDGMSMQVLRSWLKSHPGDARRVMETDQSFVFFREQPVGDPSLGAEGSEGVPLTAGASLAVDMKLHPLGAPMYVAATRPDADPAKPDHVIQRLMVAQDTGGAIKGPVRGDVFWGFGADAESIAGRMKSSGQLYVFLPKSLASRLAPSTDFKTP
jgi:membrane-bound lytic murein transglycosylase A